MRWNERKKHLDAKGVLIEFREGKIYWCAYGVNIGIEIDGKNVDCIRPVLVLRKFSKECFWGVPLVTKSKKWFEKVDARTKKFYYHLGERSSNSVSLVNLTQLRMFDVKRIRWTRATEYKVIKVSLHQTTVGLKFRIC